MKRLFHLAAVIALLTSCGTGSASKTAPVTPSAPQPHKGNQYIHLVGKLDNKYEVTMDLTLNDEYAEVYYSYNSTMQPISLYGVYHGDSLDINGGSTMYDTIYERFAGKFIDGSYIGEWSKGDKKMPFSLKSDVSGSVPFEFYTFSDSSVLIPKKKDSPQAKYLYRILQPSGSSYKDLATQIYLAYTRSRTLPAVKESIRKECKDFFDGYHDQLKDMLKDTSMMSWSANYEESKWAQVVFNTNDILVIGLTYYEYSGGAHGMSGTSFINLNTSTNTLIKLEDFFNAGDSVLLKQLLEKNVRQVRSIPDTTTLQDAGLFVEGNNLPIPHNYYVTPTGIMFEYSLYEIASYAEGQLTFFIPFKEMGASIKRQSWMKF